MHGPRLVRPGLITIAAILLYNNAQRERAEAVVHRMVKRAVEMEGTVTVSRSLSPRISHNKEPPSTDQIILQGEHGVGLVKRDYLPHELGESTVDTMRQVSKDTLRTEILQGEATFADWGPFAIQIKKALDPLSLLNCDKVVRVQKPASGEVAEW